MKGSNSTGLMSLLPRSLGALLSIVALGGVMAYSFSQEKPVGRVSGRVLLGDIGKPLANVRVTLATAEAEDDEPGALYDGKNAGVRRFRARTDAQGNWKLSGVPVGMYHVSAASRAHSIDEQKVVVTEDETTQVPLQLKRSEPDLQLTQQQREFLPSEEVTLPIHGYVDGKKPVGTDSLQLRVYRARLGDILSDATTATAFGRVSSTYERVESLPQELLKPAKSAAPVPVQNLKVALKKADLEGFYHERVKLGKLSSGLYLVEVGHGKSSTCGSLLVSDTSLVVKKTKKQLLAYVVDSVSGEPRREASIQVFQQGKSLAQVRTSKDGLAEISLPERNDSSGNLLTVASFNGNEATVGQYDNRDYEDEGHGGYVVHTYTDRPIYRPGARVSYKGIVRRTLDAGLRYAVPKAEPVDIEVRDPSGNRIAQSRTTTNPYGSFHGSFDLSPEAPSGQYVVVSTIDGEEHTDDVTVASYRKPEFSATVTPQVKHSAFGEPVSMTVDSTYYFGAPVAGAKVHYTITRMTDWSSVWGGSEEAEDNSKLEGEAADYEETGYGDTAYYDGSGEQVSEGDVVLDSNGHAVIQFTPQLHENTDEDSEEGESEEETRSSNPLDEEPQDQTYAITAYVTDSADREVEASSEVLVTTGNFRLSAETEGYFATPGDETQVAVQARDFEDKPLVGKEVEFTTSSRRWDDENEVWIDGQVSSFKGTTGADGKTEFALKPTSEGVLYLKARATDDKGREVTATQSLWVAGEEGGDYDAQYNTLSVLTDRKRYKTGETARAIINSETSGGTALMTIEGSRLFRQWLVPLKHRSTAVKIPLVSDYGPNITLAVCMVRDKKFASSAVPLRVEVPNRSVKVELSSDRDKVKPGEAVTYQIKTSDTAGRGVPAEVSLGVVDESIYALQEDYLGMLRQTFYPADPNSVQTSYSFEPLYLGDVNKATPDIEARKKFLDTAFWKPDVLTDKNGRASVKVTLPDNLTKWRATAVAETLDSAFGHTTDEVTVAKDFFVRLETPRFLTGGDRTKFIALVHNDTGEAQQAVVKLEAKGVEVSGATTQKVSVPAGSVGRVEWPVVAPELAGSAQLKLLGWTEEETGYQWTDGVESSVPIRARGRERVVSRVGQIDKPVVEQKLDVDPAGVASSTKVTVRLDPSISDAMVGSLKYLVGFPYGCTEQTMSRFLPDLLVQRVLRLQKQENAQSQQWTAQLPRMVRDSVTRLARMQHNDGGWGWWENDDSDPWMTAYVLSGLSEAQKSGYAINADLLITGRDAGLKMLDKPEETDGEQPMWRKHAWDDSRAFLLYALAAASPTEEQSKAIRLHRSQMKTGGLSAQGMSYLVLLDRQLGIKSDSWSRLRSQLKSDGAQLRFWEAKGREEASDWDDQTATAIGLRAMLAVAPKDPNVAPVVQWLMSRRQNDAWGNTRDTSWTLGALCDYLRVNQAASNQGYGVLTIKLNGKEVRRVNLSEQPAGALVLQLPARDMLPSGNVLRFERSGGSSPIFYSAQVRQTLAGDLADVALTSTVPISVTREYRLLQTPEPGTLGWPLRTRETNNRMNKGDRIRVRLTFSLPEDVSYVLIEDPFPAGLETNERGSVDGEDWSNWWSQTDVRDDRVAFFARTMTKGKHVIEYNLRAQTSGEFAAGPTLFQAMYAPECVGESAAGKVVVE